MRHFKIVCLRVPEHVAEVSNELMPTNECRVCGSGGQIIEVSRPRMKSAAERAAEAIGTYWDENCIGGMVASEQMAAIIRNEYQELEQAAEKLIERYVCNPGTNHEFVACITEVTPWTSCKGGRKTWNMWGALRSALAKVRGQE